MIWFLQNWARLAQERAAIEELQGSAPWLKGASWGIEADTSVALRLDVDIMAHGTLYPVRMTYPATFPANPPTVKPRGTDERWSAHQYGAGGELCLEWGPDTWLPEISGAQILESAFKLLSTENPAGAGSHDPVVSRHELTAGQKIRGSFYRFPATSMLRQRLAALPPGAMGTMVTSALLQGESLVIFVRELRFPDGEAWSDPTIPSRLEVHGWDWSGVFLRALAPAHILEATGNIEKLKAVLRKYAPHGFGDAGEATLGGHKLLLIEDSANGLHLFRLSSGQVDLKRFDTVTLSSDRSHERLGPDVEVLAGKRVGIVGVGSLGSKIALSLARSGVNHFILVDDDVFMPENACRHTLDWRNVGEHKVVGVKEQLMLVSPIMEVDVRRLRLTGQESTASVAGVLQDLARCDLIVDATSDPTTFNQLALVSRQHRRPLIWAEVYAGGIGGMVARHRPGKDADPFTMRARFHGFTAEAGTPPPPSPALTPYAAVDEREAPLIATDPDVGVIASYASGMALDTLSEREPSLFPYSLYLVGLARGWVFEQPFHVIPIETGSSDESAGPAASPEVIGDGVQFMTALLKQHQDGRTSAN